MPSLESLPFELLCEMAATHLTPFDICALAQTCTSLRPLSREQSVWKQLCLRRWGPIVLEGASTSQKDVLVPGGSQRKLKKTRGQQWRKTGWDPEEMYQVTEMESGAKVENDGMESRQREQQQQQQQQQENDDGEEENKDEEEAVRSISWRDYYQKRVCWFPSFQPSPLRLFQEGARLEPWKMLAGCIMLGRTSGGPTVVAVVNRFLEIYPWPLQVVRANPAVLEELMRPLGIYKIRAKRVQAFCQQFFGRDDWAEPGELYGIGDFGNDSWRLLCRGGFEDWRKMKLMDWTMTRYKAWLYQDYVIRENPSALLSAEERLERERVREGVRQVFRLDLSPEEESGDTKEDWRDPKQDWRDQKEDRGDKEEERRDNKGERKNGRERRAATRNQKRKRTEEEETGTTEREKGEGGSAIQEEKADEGRQQQQQEEEEDQTRSPFFSSRSSTSSSLSLSRLSFGGSESGLAEEEGGQPDNREMEAYFERRESIPLTSPKKGTHPQDEEESE